MFSEDRLIKKRFRPAAAFKTKLHFIEIFQAKGLFDYLNGGYPLSMAYWPGAWGPLETHTYTQLYKRNASNDFRTRPIETVSARERLHRFARLRLVGSVPFLVIRRVPFVTGCTYILKLKPKSTRRDVKITSNNKQQ